ncbi:MAG: hypothetical protein PHD00_10005 [Bacteroidales bacterium]|jgi:hypothetical protein|nr:hypothetical protein [Bacteroidales bacterium]MDD4671990.1 hypothetical protein [Bacteroidales bacterium]MDY0349464.1 hypothetical protein [Tenuifilaceae bacterium]
MKEGEVKRLIEKYKEGNTTLNEEQFLFDNAQNSESSFEVWASFVRNNKTEAPKNFNDTLWESFQNKRIRRRKILVGIMSAAASAILLISLSISNPRQKELNFAEKEALLNQALNMLSNTDRADVAQNIIFENEMLIIYTTAE